MLNTLRWGSIRIAVLFASCVVCWPASSAATPFRNLDFESAVIGTPVNQEVPSSQAIPDWNVNSFDPGKVLYDEISAGSHAVSIQDGKGGLFDFNPLDGDYSLLLQTEFGPTKINAWISQVGDISAGAHSILFLSDTFAIPTVSLNGIVIPVTLQSSWPPINGGRPVDTYIGDIRSFSGQQNVELKFESTAFNSLDDIQFSSTIVPEPCMLTLLTIGLLGGFAVGLTRRISSGRARRSIVRP